jgi:hypothetical protein
MEQVRAQAPPAHLLVLVSADLGHDGMVGRTPVATPVVTPRAKMNRATAMAAGGTKSRLAAWLSPAISAPELIVTTAVTPALA